MRMNTKQTNFINNKDDDKEHIFSQSTKNFYKKKIEFNNDSNINNNDYNNHYMQTDNNINYDNNLNINNELNKRNNNNKINKNVNSNTPYQSNQKNLRRINSESNLQKDNSLQTGYNLKIFKNTDIFNSLLLMICNTPYINNYFTSNEFYKFLSTKSNNNLNLTIILMSIIKNYYIKKNLENIYSNLQVSFNPEKSKNYYNDFKNIIQIYLNIMKKIHDELKINDQSIISKFVGENKIITYKACEHNQSRQQQFLFLTFNLEQVSNYIHLNKCNFYDCFKYYYSKTKFKCNLCNCFYEQSLTLHYSPKILVIFVDNNINCHYSLEKEIDLKNIPNEFIENKNGIYELISFLSYHNQTKEIIVYYFNLKEKLWYIYSKGKFEKVTKIYINVPLMVFYKIKNDFELKDNINEQQLNTQKLKKNLNETKDEENEINQEENSLKQKIKELKYQVEKAKEENLKIKKYNNYLCEENKNLKKELSNNISLILMSFDEDIHFSIICKKTDNLSKIKDIIYRKYPELKNKIIKFKKNGNIIYQYKNLEENNIHDGDSIIIYIK